MSKNDLLGFDVGPSLPEKISLAEFIKTFSHLVPLFFSACDEVIGDSEYDQGLRVKITRDELYLTSLHPDLAVNQTYTQVIPDNGHGFIYDLSLVEKGKKTLEIKVRTTVIETDFLTFRFKLSNPKKINFPEDYFLKGYPIFTAILQASILGIDPGIVTGKNHNSTLSKEHLLKELCSEKNVKID